MNVSDSQHYRTFVDGLARSESGRLLHQELRHRWPESIDELAEIARYAPEILCLIFQSHN